MNYKLLINTIVTGLLCSCSDSSQVIVSVTDEIINHNYIGNGVEWDPYDEALAWGTPLNDNDWEKLFSRLDYMRPSYVRCMINCPYTYYDAATGAYDPYRNRESITRLLDYCQKKDIMVIYGEYNPPSWDMKQDQKWIDMSVDYLNSLVNGNGYTCIKYFVIFNEPDGDWACTNGDFNMWLSVLERFRNKMSEYDGLLDKVSFAGPDVVSDYKNSNSEYDTAGWLSNTITKADSVIGLYDIHCYPGQAEVHDGAYRSLLHKYKNLIPSDKKIVIGEAGYKYWREADSLLMAEYNRRVEGHKYTRGSDCNMLVYDYFYGVDMPLFISEAMNSGISGVAAWMLDDAMHSTGDSGRTEDIKIWGMWNILGEEAFNDPSQEDIRPWYYTWSLMCRYFPRECNVLHSESNNNDIYTVAAATTKGELSIAVINIGERAHAVKICLPTILNKADLFRYSQPDYILTDSDGYPIPEKTDITGNTITVEIPTNSMILITEMN